jgi:hypothetical protein
MRRGDKKTDEGQGHQRREAERGGGRMREQLHPVFFVK